MMRIEIEKKCGRRKWREKLKSMRKIDEDNKVIDLRGNVGGRVVNEKEEREKDKEEIGKNIEEREKNEEKEKIEIG